MAIHKSFFREILGCGICWRHKPAIRDFPPICEGFLPQKFSAIQYGKGTAVTCEDKALRLSGQLELWTIGQS